jgi:hypothetical protein
VLATTTTIILCENTFVFQHNINGFQGNLPKMFLEKIKPRQHQNPMSKVDTKQTAFCFYSHVYLTLPLLILLNLSLFRKVGQPRKYLGVLLGKALSYKRSQQ